MNGFAERIVAALEKAATERSRTILAGQLSFEDYRLNAGFVSGIRHAVEVVRELDAQTKGSDYDDDDQV